jgi:hypothetical protein
MKCSVGDRVRFLNDVGGGKITRIIDKYTIAVMNEDGFEIPVLESEVILIDQEGDTSVFKRVPLEFEKNSSKENFSFQKCITVDTSIGESNNIKANRLDTQTLEIDFSKLDDTIPDPGGEQLSVLIAFVPVEQKRVVESDQELYLINDSPYRAFYTISLWETSNVKPLKAGFIHADTKELISLFKRNELNSHITMNVQMLFFKNINYLLQQPEYIDLRINPTRFCKQGSFTENDFFDEKALILSIADTKKEEMFKTLTDKAISESISQKDIEIKPDAKIAEPDLVEVDLHIHQLVDNYTSIQPSEILEIQMARFTTALETGIRSKSTRKMVFIHGLGNGRLKNEVLRKLSSDYPKLRYQDASFKEYGFGATLVFLK